MMILRHCAFFEAFTKAFGYVSLEELWFIPEEFSFSLKFISHNKALFPAYKIISTVYFPM